MSEPGQYDAVLGGKYRQTTKWVGAKQIAANLHLTGENQDDVYSQLNTAGYYWNAESKTWELLAAGDADPPTELINIRVWSDAKQVEGIAKQLTTALQAQGLKLIEQSKPYPCRPPNQLEARVYLKFQPPQN